MVDHSPDICRRIAYWVYPRSADLASLCRTCKAFQREAEVRLYENMAFSDPSTAYLACRTIILQSRYGPFVRLFWFNQESRRQSQTLPHSFWVAIQDALSRMSNLDALHLSDNTFSNSWILDPEHFTFQLSEAKLRFAWDEYTVNFLQNQHRLRVLQLIDQMDDVVRLQIQPSALPFLQVFDGNLLIGVQFLTCPLTHIQLAVDMEGSQALELLPRLALAHKTLHAVNILSLPEDVSARALCILANSCPLLRHVGILHLPIVHRQKFYHALMQMHYVRTIELDVHRWQPLPSPAAQRAVVTEIRTYRPTIQHVVLWVGQTRIRWILQGSEWFQRVDNNQHPQGSVLWTSA
ncbi:hypothetical protein M378DRAFT_13243 [Amanita muscaria Koide BX008]|uniref:F-box domain-containing protein n=1 Tax=Amanita muscaria (strain Koide BX008) TaxID=946122 RepID=A0A0C2WK15_AMAMK|nr:hypothetical protein M378DRAFT_13243 [Amanita muscaria Koide BX008]